MLLRATRRLVVNPPALLLVLVLAGMGNQASAEGKEQVRFPAPGQLGPMSLATAS